MFLIKKYITLAISLFGIVLLFSAMKPAWGFFGHKRINRLAVFTLPPEMIGFFKENIDYITEHAVDPDKRRYAAKHEAVRHYIDLDHWGEYPFENVPRKWLPTIAKYSDIYVVNNAGDTVQVKYGLEIGDERIADSPIQEIPAEMKSFTYHNILPVYYEDDWVFNCDSVAKLFGAGAEFDCQSAFGKDQFSGYGILPYHLVNMQRRLTTAFKKGDVNRILRLSAEFGHYLGDAHVPLHTTENYNGQMTNQVGIHGFWESRLPELFADEEYDFFVGQAEYFDDPTQFYWDIVLESHTYVEDLLQIERDLKKTFPSDQQFCFEQRGTTTINTQCKEFCRKYHDLLDGQVEKRMTKAVRAIGSAWFTAWVDAGQPNLNALTKNALTEAEIEEQKALENKYKGGKIIGRSHDQ